MNRAWKDQKTLIPGRKEVAAAIATTTGGTLASTYVHQYGLKITKTATKTGRYTLQLIDHLGAAQDAVRFIGVQVNILGPDDAAMTDAKGIWQGVIRDIDIGAGAKDGTVEIQFQDADSGADQELQDGASIYVVLAISDQTGP